MVPLETFKASFRFYPQGKNHSRTCVKGSDSVLHWLKFQWSSKVLWRATGGLSASILDLVPHTELYSPGPGPDASPGPGKAGDPSPGSAPGASVCSAALLRHSTPLADSPPPPPPLPSSILVWGGSSGRSLGSSCKFLSLLQFQMQTCCVDTVSAAQVTRPGDSVSRSGGPGEWPRSRCPRPRTRSRWWWCSNSGTQVKRRCRSRQAPSCPAVSQHSPSPVTHPFLLRRIT